MAISTLREKLLNCPDYLEEGKTALNCEMQESLQGERTLILGLVEYLGFEKVGTVGWRFGKPWNNRRKSGLFGVINEVLRLARFG